MDFRLKRIFLAALIVRHVCGNTIDSIKDMSSFSENDLRSFFRIDTGLDTTSLHDVFSAEKLIDREYRIHMIGDSTTRNQFLGLCSILNADILPTAKNCLPSPECIGQGWGYTRLIATGTFDASKPTVASQIPKIIVTALNAYRTSKFDVIYFGSTALHMLQLFPAIDRGDAYWPKAINFREDVARMIQHVAAFTTCPVFHTVHYVCDERFYGERVAAINKNYKHDNGHLESICRKRLPQAVRVCENYSMTSQGTTFAAQVERRGIEMSNASVAVVDAFSLTYKQCWASSDGIHYRKLLPIKLKLLSEHVRTCQHSRTNLSDVMSAENYSSAPSVSAFKDNSSKVRNAIEQIPFRPPEVSSTLGGNGRAFPSKQRPRRKRTKGKKGTGGKLR